MTKTTPKLLIGILVAVVIAFGVAYLASPLLAVRSLVDAAKTGDEAALERLVDFPAFRDSLKEELNARLMSEMRAELGGSDSGWGAIGMMLAPSLIGGAVDALVTPPAIAAMVRTAEAPSPENSLRGAGAREEGADIRQAYGYRDLNTFVLTLSDADRPEQKLHLLMERRNLFSWKLAGVDLPEAEPA